MKILIGDYEQVSLQLEAIDNYPQEKGYVVWDEIHESPDGRFYIASPTGDPRFEGFIPDCEEIDRPEDWNGN